MFLDVLANVVVSALEATLCAGLLRLQTHRAATDLASVAARLERLLTRHVELVVLVDDGHPVTELVGVVHAVAVRSRAFDEWRGAEVFQTRAGTGQRLTTALRAAAQMLRERTRPIARARAAAD